MALTYVSELPVQIRGYLYSLVSSLRRRFGRNTLSPVHRANLNSLRKELDETLEEYAARVNIMMSRAYPGVQGQLYEEIAVEHLLNGLGDSTVAYDVLIKKSSTMDQAIEMMSWHDCCKGSVIIIEGRRSGRLVLQILQEKPLYTPVRKPCDESMVAVL